MICPAHSPSRVAQYEQFRLIGVRLRCGECSLFDRHPIFPQLSNLCFVMGLPSSNCISFTTGFRTPTDVYVGRMRHFSLRPSGCCVMIHPAISFAPGELSCCVFYSTSADCLLRQPPRSGRPELYYTLSHTPRNDFAWRILPPKVGETGNRCQTLGEYTCTIILTHGSAQKVRRYRT